MNLIKKILCGTVIILLFGCASTKSVDIIYKDKIHGPKIIAINGDRDPWIYEIEKRIRKNGFIINRLVSKEMVTEKEKSGKIKEYNKATARYVLTINGYAPNTKLHRCYGGGYNFDYIDAELIDIVENKTVFHYSNSGYSEGCQPLSGHIFGDIANMLNDSWEK